MRAIVKNSAVKIPVSTQPGPHITHTWKGAKRLPSNIFPYA